MKKQKSKARNWKETTTMHIWPEDHNYVENLWFERKNPKDTFADTFHEIVEDHKSQKKIMKQIEKLEARIKKLEKIPRGRKK